MRSPQRRTAAGVAWPELLLTLGLGATIASIGGVAAELVKTQGTENAQKCTLAAEMLQDDSPTPYIGELAKRQVATLAARRFMRCVKE